MDLYDPDQQQFWSSLASNSTLLTPEEVDFSNLFNGPPSMFETSNSIDTLPNPLSTNAFDFDLSTNTFPNLPLQPQNEITDPLDLFLDSSKAPQVEQAATILTSLHHAPPINFDLEPVAPLGFSNIGPARHDHGDSYAIPRAFGSTLPIYDGSITQECDRSPAEECNLNPAHDCAMFEEDPCYDAACLDRCELSTDPESSGSQEATTSLEKKYQCRFCDQRYSYAASLSVHEREHNATKKYRCKECGHQDNDRANLMRHCDIHAPKRFNCKFCSKAFSKKANAMRHLHARSCKEGKAIMGKGPMTRAEIDAAILELPRKPGFDLVETIG